MKKIIFLKGLIVLISACASVKSPIPSNCITPEELPKINKEKVTDDIKNFLKELEQERKDVMKSLWHPPSTLVFDENCTLPLNFSDIGFSVGVLLVQPESKIILEVNSDKIEHAKNPRINKKRGKVIKQMLVDYGIDPNRIKIKNYRDKRPMATNKTEEGRQRNRYIFMELTNVSF